MATVSDAIRDFESFQLLFNKTNRFNEISNEYVDSATTLIWGIFDYAAKCSCLNLQNSKNKFHTQNAFQNEWIIEESLLDNRLVLSIQELLV